MKQTALVTGASSGFGAEFARQLAARGYGLILTARRADRLDALRREITAQQPVQVDAIALDLGAADGPRQLHAACAALGRPVEVLINNAGFGLHGRFLDLDLDRQQQMVDLDISAVMQLSWLFGREMASRRQGYILQVASVAAAQPSPSYVVYAACKAFVDYFGAAFNHELRGSGVSCTVSLPGPSPTEFGAVADQGRSLMHRLGSLPPQEVVRRSLDALFARKGRVVPGWSNALMTTISGLSPRLVAMPAAEFLIRD